MARLRAVVMIHPAGLGGSPSCGQRAAAVAERVLDGVLGHADVAEDAGEHGDRAAVFLPEHPLDLVAAGLGASAGRQACRSRTVFLGSAAPRPPAG